MVLREYGRQTKVKRILLGSINYKETDDKLAKLNMQKKR
jgi:hypothetical protein